MAASASSILDAIRTSDLVLAINEGLANAAEFAYLQTEQPGTIDIQAVLRRARRRR